MGSHLTPVSLQFSLMQSGLAGKSGITNQELAGNVRLSSTQEELELQSIGEANVQLTPLGILNAYRRLAAERRTAPPKYSPVYQGLDGATRFGMSRLAASDVISISGKTGTSLSDEGRWTHAWFAGFAPSDSPKIAVVVFLERGTGPADAAPIARKLFEAYAKAKAK
jgi:hypothetical protein